MTQIGREKKLNELLLIKWILDDVIVHVDKKWYVG